MGWLENADRSNQRRMEIDRELHRDGWVDSREAERSMAIKGVILGVYVVGILVAALVDWLS